MLEEVQAEGGKRISAADFLRGHPIEVGTRLG
jgi:methionyl-tRNA formyltransferase